MSESSATVILIHGLWMGGVVLRPYQRWLRDEGFTVHRFSYPSWRGGLTDNAALLAHFVRDTPGAVIHLVGHSLGGLLVLNILRSQPDRRIRRAVLLGTPSAGSHCAARLAAIPVLSMVAGRSVGEWIDRPTGKRADQFHDDRRRESQPSTPDRLPPSVEIGVIAGTRSIGTGRVVPGLARPNDGLIALEETRLAEAKDRIALPVNHSGMLFSRACARQAATFLRTGAFVHA